MVWLLLLAQETQVERETHWILETKVTGQLSSEYSGDYPFEYEGWTTLTSAEVEALRKEGDVSKELAKRLALAFAEPDPEKRDGKDPRARDPKTADEVSDASFTIREGAIRGKLTILRKEGPGTRKIVLELKGSCKDVLTLEIEKSTVSGTWDWGGGVADLGGKLSKLSAASREPKR